VLYVAHQTNQTTLVVSKLSLVVCIEAVLQSICIFFTQLKEGIQICEACQDIGNKGLEVVPQCKKSLDIDAWPFEVGVRKCICHFL
jgi:phage-related holin